jgi:hypothetical protein
MVRLRVAGLFLLVLRKFIPQKLLLLKIVSLNL